MTNESKDKIKCSKCGIIDGEQKYQQPMMSHEYVGYMRTIGVKIYIDPDHPNDRTKDRGFCFDCLHGNKSFWIDQLIYGDQIKRKDIIGGMRSISDAKIDLELYSVVLDVLDKKINS